MRAVVVTPKKPGSGRLAEVPDPQLREGEVLVRVQQVGLDGTDAEILEGQYGEAPPGDDYLIIGQTLVVPLPESQFVMPPVPDISEPVEAPVAVAVAPEPEPEPPLVVVAPPAPPAPPPSSGQSWTREEVVEAICSLPWPCERMVAIAACESGLRPDAVNPAGYYGLFQISHAFDGWDNPWTNAQVAYYEKYLPMLEWSGDGLAPWPVCRYY